MELPISFGQILLKLFHLIALIQFAYGIHYDVRANADRRIEQDEFFKPKFGGNTRFLTYWGLVSENDWKKNVIKTMFAYIKYMIKYYPYHSQ